MKKTSIDSTEIKLTYHEQSNAGQWKVGELEVSVWKGSCGCWNTLFVGSTNFNGRELAAKEAIAYWNFLIGKKLDYKDYL